MKRFTWTRKHPRLRRRKTTKETARDCSKGRRAASRSWVWGHTPVILGGERRSGRSKPAHIASQGQSEPHRPCLIKQKREKETQEE